MNTFDFLMQGLMTAAEPITIACPRPVAHPVMLQGWHDLTSIHWRYDPAVVQRLLPDDLIVDTCDGSAWVGLIPFHMRAVRVLPGPVVPWLGSFVEINVRTYVTDHAGRRGVWFWSLDVPRSPIVGVARSDWSDQACCSNASSSRA